MQLTRAAIKISVCLAMAMLAFSCTKDDPVIDDPGNDPQNPKAPYFMWKIDGGTTVTADSAIAYVQSHVIFVYEHGGGSLEINLAEMSAGTYTISSATGNQLQYTQDNVTHEASGTFAITSSTSDKMSGHFDCEFVSGPLSTITGTFSEILKRYN